MLTPVCFQGPGVLCMWKQVIYLSEEHRIIVPEGQTGDITVTLQVPEAIPATRLTWNSPLNPPKKNEHGGLTWFD